MRYLIDSSAWIEYLEGGKAGEKVSNFLKEQNNEIFVINLNIAEVISKVRRAKKDYELAYKVIITNSKILNITPKIAKSAGLLHAELKNKNKGFSLADALIIKAAESISAK